jgi:hypothetical protein
MFWPIQLIARVTPDCKAAVPGMIRASTVGGVDIEKIFISKL